MGVSLIATSISILAVLLCVKSQMYGYQPYGQYFSGQNPVYNPYLYQPYVSSQPVPYTPYYGYPVQSYAPENYPNSPIYNYPAQTYPNQNYEVQNYPSQQNYYPWVYPQYTGVPPSYVPYPYVNNGSSNLNQTEKDPYANIKVDIIDIEPKYFSYYKRFFNLEDNTYPVDVIDHSNSGSAQPSFQTQPYYTVKSESKNFNFSSVPQTINTHDVQNKTYSFKRTFTVDPSKKENAVINLNFVNGVQLTTTQEPEVELADQAETIVAPEGTEEVISTTTENDEPSNILTWIG